MYKKVSAKGVNADNQIANWPNYLTTYLAVLQLGAHFGSILGAAEPLAMR
jgi:hypothetical protein